MARVHLHTVWRHSPLVAVVRVGPPLILKDLNEYLNGFQAGVVGMLSNVAPGFLKRSSNK